MLDKDGTERRVYVLPKELLERLRAYAARKAITAEVEAVRRLLDKALQMEDSAIDILNKLKARFADEKDLRVLARDVLAAHVLVKKINYEENAVSFELADGSEGLIDNEGKTFVGNGPDRWDEHPPLRLSTKVVKAGGGGPNWDAPKKGGDVEDEIPF